MGRTKIEGKSYKLQNAPCKPLFLQNFFLTLLLSGSSGLDRNYLIISTFYSLAFVGLMQLRDAIKNCCLGLARSL